MSEASRSFTKQTRSRLWLTANLFQFCCVIDPAIPLTSKKNLLRSMQRNLETTRSASYWAPEPEPEVLWQQPYTPITS